MSALDSSRVWTVIKGSVAIFNTAGALDDILAGYISMIKVGYVTSPDVRLMLSSGKIKRILKQINAGFI